MPINLIDHKIPKGIQVKTGFYILCRVKHHLYHTEPWYEGWGEATDVLTRLWVSFDVTDRRLDRVPPLVLDALDRYVDHHIETGSFLRAVLENNLSGAFGAADMQNRYALFDIISYIYNELPMVCWGSKENVEKWLTPQPK